MGINYRRNEDRWPVRQGPNYNLAEQPEDISGSGVVTEPVTVPEMKNYLRLQGFDESGEFDFDDTLIGDLITSARERIEIHTDLSLIPKTLEARVTNLCGRVSLRGGPVTGTVTAVDVDGEGISAEDIKTAGTKFPDLVSPLQENMVLTYDAGYTFSNIPKGLKLAIMEQVCYDYEHRGDELDDKGVCAKSQLHAEPYRRTSVYG